MGYVASFGKGFAWLLLLPGNKACDAFGMDRSDFRDLVRMLVNSLFWTTIGVCVVALTA